MEAFATSMPVMETIPNHVMMMSGVRPDRSGVPANSILDRTTEKLKPQAQPVLTGERILEMAQLVRQYELGVLIPTVDPGAIAATIGRLDRQCIDHHKRRALAAARELCWERESQRLVGAYSAALQASTG